VANQGKESIGSLLTGGHRPLSFLRFSAPESNSNIGGDGEKSAARGSSQLHVVAKKEMVLPERR
jgi:hypothetical protein